ncbi:hypothetical protein ACP49_05725 [Clostridium botulinum]|uniref:acyl carrier protein n=1 Tax=Clostridium botulinum TaxID=1491 RepID=UPI0005F907E7|nr:phosphopantetheine-binding protein [Clostridium botulinum]KOM98656.1 hypothetical protein ACP53_02600 [Clostridium botulinum]KON00096.1 hypothetical protein ACP49_05725 [Clostridium botulinum]MBY7002861.1 acyl carrier protein [Clostridium botulinum]MCR1146684.1 acyl carrier protein [Clostridium botulinum]NFH92445.1 acyl carrier protein [Clostridium botulinum]
MNINEYNRFIKIIKEKLPPNFNNLEIKKYFTLSEDLMINSILFYSLLIDIEKNFNITFENVTMDADEYRTVGDLAQYITQLLEEEKSGVK